MANQPPSTTLKKHCPAVMQSDRLGPRFRNQLGPSVQYRATRLPVLLTCDASLKYASWEYPGSRGHFLASMFGLSGFESYFRHDLAASVLMTSHQSPRSPWEYEYAPELLHVHTAFHRASFFMRPICYLLWEIQSQYKLRRTFSEMTTSRVNC